MNTGKQFRDGGNVRGYPELTEDQRRELIFFRNNKGRQWKNKLLAEWRADRSQVNPILRELRNTHGPVWLSKMQLKLAGAA